MHTEPRADSLDWHQGLVGHGLHGLALVSLVAKYGQGQFVFLLVSLVGHFLQVTSHSAGTTGPSVVFAAVFLL